MRHPPRVFPLAAVLLSCAVAAGCGPPGGPDVSGPQVAFNPCAPLTVVPDPGTTDADAAGLAAGIALWNQRAGAHLTIAAAAPADGAPADGAPADGAPADGATPGLPIHFQAAAPPFHGLYDAPRGEVYINTDLSGEALAITICHEIGHAFGLVHVPSDQRSSVMNPNNLIVEPTAQDVDTLAMRWGVCLASPAP